MPNPHFKITITKRSEGRSAVAGAAYQSGSRLFSEYDQKYKNYTGKKEVVYTEILLPANAPPEYADRQTLWNAAEEIEKQWNSQLARRFVITFPREVPPEQYPQMAREYCNEFFVSRGMCCDFAIHDPDPPGHNPHCHVMLTMRAMDENGQWLPKSRKVYDLDENGERIRLPSGNWKCHKESTVDWNEQTHAEEWRQGWADVQNRHLENLGRPERVDLRSYERQGIDKVPTVHMGPAVAEMERKGILTNIGNLNRDIKSANRMMDFIRKTVKDLREWITEIQTAIKEATAEIETPRSPSLPDLLNAYLDIRKSERSEWSVYGQRKGEIDDLKAVSEAMIYLKNQGLNTLDDLDEALQKVNGKAKAISTELRKTDRRMKDISNIEKALSECRTHKAVHDEYLKIGWKARQEKFAESHKGELDSYNKAYRYLKKQGIDLNVDMKALHREYATLEARHGELSVHLSSVREELKPLKDIRYWVGKALAPDEEKTGKKPEPKHSITEQLRFYQEQNRQEADRKNEQKKKQNIEI